MQTAPGVRIETILLALSSHRLYWLRHCASHLHPPPSEELHNPRARELTGGDNLNSFTFPAWE